MDEIVTEIEIDAPPNAVWRVLTDFESYPEWNPVMKINGESMEGERLEVQMAYENMRPMTFRPTVLIVDEPIEFRWKGRLFVPGLYDGEHRFVLTELDDGGRTRLTHAETFRGPLVGFINRRIGDDVEVGFNQQNEALKQQVEKQTAS
ncbi:SRPBCC domain-containing protein [Natrinema zhouii]|uniref:SRPBCC domain-containing protein n=1 Tax=Natrinema zhouii TaxID=1710539 RepID=A0A7D6GQW7_9EURY|nr:SRPBCC domain-containing protein [Natrinema zhouii]QLK25523.1 SRPBCC domain-containing protein [Natrinema zhouii]